MVFLAFWLLVVGSLKGIDYQEVGMLIPLYLMFVAGAIIVAISAVVYQIEQIRYRIVEENVREVYDEPQKQGGTDS